ncbi:hypothetical protein C7S20_13855 [Christiangramia fulva]|uniref:Uncharacterized protein n=1 Tax=Christiangramia fulva TaxID=2126553 RepID=A0A2R3Z7L2_9FLAO|nr:hypothetical protein [Christiangramia fulva]AVR46259.1 hypothetical protein C7S20_13855 [Christiangramia fulva]
MNTNKYTLKLAFWTLGWVLSLALVTFGAKFIWNFNVTISVIMILANLLIGVGMILANIRLLQQIDELQRKIQLDAMGITLGVALVAGIGYSALDITNVIGFDAEISHLVFLLGITYIAAILIGNARYK